MLKSFKSAIQIISLLTISFLFFALWENPEIGFSAVAGLALGSVFATQWCIQKAWRIKEKSKSSLKLVQVTALVVLSFTFSTTGFVAGAEYGGLEKVTGQFMSEVTNESQMASISGSFKTHLRQATETL